MCANVYMYAYMGTYMDSCIYMFKFHRNAYAQQCVYIWLQISWCDVICVIGTHFFLSAEYLHAE